VMENFFLLLDLYRIKFIHNCETCITGIALDN